MTLKCEVHNALNLDSFKDKYLLIVFTSSNCEYCTSLKPIIDEFESKVKYPNVVIGNYDSDQNDILEEFKVYEFLTIFLISDGKQVIFKVERSVKSLVEFIEKLGYISNKF